MVKSNQRAARSSSALTEALPGTVLDGKYRLDEQIGKGGFGVVFRATHLAMKRAVAVKIFNPVGGNDSAAGLERFQLEAISSARLNHPNAIAVYDAGISSKGLAYFVMELLAGHSLAGEIERAGSLSVARAAEIFLPVCSALAEAHALGIIHRDIKPDNIFLHNGPKGEVVKVVDFGISKIIETGDLPVDQLMVTGLIGTPEYMAPERLDNRPYDERSDIYSLGIMLYQMLTGSVPFPIAEGGLWPVIYAQINHPPRPLTELRRDASQALADLVAKLLSKRAADRPAAKDLLIEFIAAGGLDQADFISLIRADSTDRSTSKVEPDSPLSQYCEKIEPYHENTETAIEFDEEATRSATLDQTSELEQNSFETKRSLSRSKVKYCPSCRQIFDLDLERCARDNSELELCTLLNKQYLLLKKIGVGGMAEVFQASNIHDHSCWAVKILNYDHFQKEGTIKERFLNEARILTSLNHPNIVKVIDFSYLDDTIYQVMELLEGNTLKDDLSVYQENFALNYQEIFTIIARICLALNTIHKQELVHRDIKPDNIFLVKNGDDIAEVKVLDFGIALWKNFHFTRSNSLIGTPEYMSPEQCARKPVDHRADIYNLGITLYQMLTGRVPFLADNGKMTDLLHKHMFEAPKRPSSLNADIPREVEKVILKALAKDPDDRQRSIIELALEFRQALEQANLKLDSLTSKELIINLYEQSQSCLR